LDAQSLLVQAEIDDALARLASLAELRFGRGGARRSCAVIRIRDGSTEWVNVQAERKSTAIHRGLWRFP
jgi:hypothetical protein